MKNFIYLLSIIIMISCGNSEGNPEGDTDYIFKSHDEILNVFKDIMTDENIKEKTKNSISFLKGDYDTSRISLYKSTEERIHDNTSNLSSEKPHDCVSYSGDFNVPDIRSTDDKKYVYKCRMNFYLPKGDSLTIKNILKHNKFELDSDYINMKVRINNTYSSFRDSKLGYGLNIMYGTGVYSAENRIKNADDVKYGGKIYLKDFLKDTVEYYKKISGLPDGRMFKADIVQFGTTFNELGTSNDYTYIYTPNNGFYMNGEIVKYLSKELNFIMGRESGEQIYRYDGIVKKREVYKEDNKMSIGYYNNISPNYLWSNVEKFKIDIDKKGYKSYTPDSTRITYLKNWKVGKNMYGKEEWFLHGKFEVNDTSDDQGGLDVDIYPRVRTTYNMGRIDGSWIVYNDYGQEENNYTYKNGIFMKGVQNRYTRHEGISVLTSVTEITNDTKRWKIFDINGVLLDEGFSKSTNSEGYGIKSPTYTN